MRRIVVNAEQPDLGFLMDAAAALRRGAVVAIPTDTLYGLAADPFLAAAVSKVFEVKGRSAERALALIAADGTQVTERIGELTALAGLLAARFWPGPLTLLMTSPPGLAPEVSGGTGKVGVRVPAHAVARGLCAAYGSPLTATSANLSGKPASNDPDEVARVLGLRIEALVDAGPTPGGPPSTVVDVTGSTPVLVRAGAIAWETIRRVCDGTDGKVFNR